MRQILTATVRSSIFIFVYSVSTTRGEGPEFRFMPLRTAPLGSPAGTFGNPVSPQFNTDLGCWEVHTSPGVEIDLDIQVFGWGQAAGNPTLGSIQASIESTSLTSGPGAALNPKGWPGSPLDGAYQAKSICGGPGGNGAPCVSPFDLKCGGVPDAFCIHNPDWIMPICASDLQLLSVASLLYEWVTVKSGDCPVDDDQVKTLGGLILDVPPAAYGTYVVRLNADPNRTFMRNAAAEPIDDFILTAACITVSCQSNLDCDDGSTCTVDSCNTETGQCKFELFPAGTACGNPASSECDLADTCDDTGRCQPNYLSAGTMCGDPAASECTQPDTCNGSGVCRHNNAPPGTPCTDDGDICTVDHCVRGECIHEPVAGEADCNESGMPDACEIAAGLSEDCDEDGVPDECRIAIGQIVDCSQIEGPCSEGPFFCQANCDPDLNGNGIIDACDDLGPQIRIMPIRTAPIGSLPGTVGDPVAPEFNVDFGCWEVISAPAVEIDLDVQGFGWGHENADISLGAIQATLDGGSLRSGLGAALNPKGWPDSAGDGAYQATMACGGPGGDGSPCTAPFDSLCGVLDAFCFRNPDWIMPACATGVHAFRVFSLDYGWGAAAQDVSCVIDDGEAKTFGGLILDVPPDAMGTYVVRLIDDPNCSFMTAGNGTNIQDLQLIPACITILCQSNVDCDDGNDCVLNSCDIATGRCQNASVPVGTPCGDQFSSECDLPDTCDGGGACQPNFVPADTACGDTTSDKCTQPDSCDGSGICQSNHEPSETPCTDDGDICTADHCEDGACVHEPVPGEADCNENGIADACEVESGFAPDCDGDGVPDECRISATQVVDCATFVGPCFAGPFFCESDCDADVNVNGIIDACDCPAGTVEWVDPPTDMIDARQPHPVNAPDPAQGVQEFIVTGPAGADRLDCWSLCESDVADGGPNAVASVVDLGEGTYAVTLDRAITAGAMTEISFVDFDDQMSVGRFASLPGDASGNAMVVAPEDILFLIDCLNGAVNPPCEIWQTDINRSGVSNAQDVLTLIDLINGADAFDVWMTESVRTACP